MPSTQYLELLSRVNDLGYPVSHLSQLAKCGVKYRDAIPLLVGSLDDLTSLSEKEDLIRALTVPWARPLATAPMISQFHQLSDDGTQLAAWTAGNALEVLWDDAYYDELADIGLNPSHGFAREMVVYGFRRSRHPLAPSTLERLLGDNDVNGHALKALLKLGVPETSEEAIRALTTDDRKWVRKLALRALEEN